MKKSKVKKPKTPFSGTDAGVMKNRSSVQNRRFVPAPCGQYSFSENSTPQRLGRIRDGIAAHQKIKIFLHKATDTSACNTSARSREISAKRRRMLRSVQSGAPETEKNSGHPAGYATSHNKLFTQSTPFIVRVHSSCPEHILHAHGASGCALHSQDLALFRVFPQHCGHFPYITVRIIST